MTHSMMQHCVKLTEFLGKVLGPDFEIALHDISDRQTPIIAIANGQISGRTVGTPLAESLLRAISGQSSENSDYRMNFTGIPGASNRMLRTSVFFLKEDDGSLAGLLCVSFDDSRYRDISERVLKLRPGKHAGDSVFVYNEEMVRGSIPASNAGENLQNSIHSITEKAIGQVTGTNGVPVDRLTLAEKMRIIGILEDKGVFMLKGAVKLVAGRLHCSQASVYRYLNRLSGENPGNSPPA